MQTSQMNLLARIFLVSSLMAGFLLSSPTAAARPVSLQDSPGRSAPAGLKADASAVSLLTIPAVPLGVGSPKVNGDCSQTEYSGGLFVDFTDGPDGTGTGSIYLVHDASSLYMCIT